MRRIIPILVLSGLLASCSGASETDITATVPGPSTTPNQFYTSPATGPVGERFLAAEEAAARFHGNAHRWRSLG
jgi:hypothetical protein